MPQRRFTEEDARHIFATVAERQKHQAPGADGLTLAELQEVARASGLDPALVAAVVAERSAPEASGSIARVMGAPAEVRRARVLTHPVNDAAWEQIVADLRKTFKTPGNPSQIGRVREWAASDPYGGQTRIAIEPLAEGSRIVAEVSQVPQAQAGLFLTALFAAMALVSAVAVLAVGAPPDLWGLVLTLSFIAAISGGTTWGMLRPWASRKAAQFDAFLDRADLATRNTAAPEKSAPLLDLNALPDAPEASGDGRTRPRTRS